MRFPSGATTLSGEGSDAASSSVIGTCPKRVPSQQKPQRMQRASLASASVFNDGADGFTANDTRDVAEVPEFEDPNLEAVVAAERDGRGVHDADAVCQEAVVAHLGDQLRVGKFHGIAIVNAVDLRRLAEDVRVDLHGAKSRRGVGAEVRVAGACGEDDDATFLEVANRAATDVGLSHLLDGDGGHHARRDAALFERVLEREGVDDRGEHAHAVGLRAVHSLACALQSAKDVAAADHDSDLHAFGTDFADFSGCGRDDVAVDPKTACATKRLAAQLEHDAAVVRRSGRFRTGGHAHDREALAVSPMPRNLRENGSPIRASARPMGRRICCIVAASVFAFIGCKPKDADPALRVDAPMQVEAKVLAQVGSRTITVGDFLEALSSLDEIDRARFETPARRKELLDALIETEALAQEALAQGLDKVPAVAQELRMGLRDAMLREVHRTVPKPEAIDVAEVKAYYDAHLASYSEPERRRLQAIVVAGDADAKRTVALLAADPSPKHFGEVAKAKSTDASAKSGAPLDLLGDVGFVGAAGDDRGSNVRVPAAVRAAAHALKGVGSVSEPVKVGASFWIVRVTQVSAARARTFDEVEKTIRVALAQDKRLAAEKAKILALAKEAKLAIDEQVLDAVFREAADAGGGAQTP